MSHPHAGDPIPVILLMGPTASGKTDLALALAEHLPWDIVSVDSAMVYRGMDIGTAKPSRETLARVPHRLVDIVEPSEPYSAARFCEDALREIRGSADRGRVPLLVGGTMLYFRALTGGLSRLPSADAALREELSAEARRVGWDALHARLMQIDPEAARRIHPNDPQRIQRALEVHRITGRRLSELQAGGGDGRAPQGLRFLRVVVAPGARALLRERIGQRFMAMLEQGFIEEVETLRARGDLGLDLPSMRSLGYRQIWRYLDGELGREQMIEQAITATRQLAKRQMTWLRNETEAHWLDSESVSWQAVRDAFLALDGRAPDRE
jgi:tRNA dimethylallyltransferase